MLEIWGLALSSEQVEELARRLRAASSEPRDPPALLARRLEWALATETPFAARQEDAPLLLAVLEAWLAQVGAPAFGRALSALRAEAERQLPRPPPAA